jgi:hypothetical protein
VTDSAADYADPDRDCSPRWAAGAVVLETGRWARRTGAAALTWASPALTTPRCSATLFHFTLFRRIDLHA